MCNIGSALKVINISNQDRLKLIKAQKQGKKNKLNKKGEQK